MFASSLVKFRPANPDKRSVIFTTVWRGAYTVAWNTRSLGCIRMIIAVLVYFVCYTYMHTKDYYAISILSQCCNMWV